MDNKNTIVFKTLANFQGVRHQQTIGTSVLKNEDMEVEVYPDSDVEDPDVKVCGICGDEGRKDLLVICSRCSDWAEHTYCMLKVPTKVPKGNWVCLECKVEEKSSNQRQDKIGRIDGNVKKQLL
ncbi:Lysine-specific demethylase lid [Olea europaea subsp. europaea]|uniref:Lysine-specific demethylase lid n=2 Tax=Olea europaea subsp. europaea TaxID=158383 RepID=A0A8S0Q7E1_OLEEU|nr:Lysine-specific demethylase lid [Olea europaea subsp. europaea]